MRPLMPLFKHRRDTILPMPAAPWTTVMTGHMSPARTPERKAKCFQREEEEEQRDQRTETTESKSEWVMETHSVSIAIIGIWHRQRICVTGGRFDSDG